MVSRQTLFPLAWHDLPYHLQHGAIAVGERPSKTLNLSAMTKRRSRTRRGIRIRGHRGNPVVRRALIRFSQWLRTEYDFPIRVPVYLFPKDYIIDMEGQKISASFFAPFQRDVEPYIRISTGDYKSLLKKCGRDKALSAFLCSLAHEIVHYNQWIETGNTWEHGVRRKATMMVRKYALTVNYP